LIIVKLIIEIRIRDLMKCLGMLIC